MSDAIYYECHITVDSESPVQLLIDVSAPSGFKLAKLQTTKIAATGTQSLQALILTGHSKTKGVLVERMRGMVGLLKERSFRVLRYKIEDVSIDSRTGDSEAIL